MVDTGVDNGASSGDDRACALRAEPQASQAEPLVPSAGEVEILRKIAWHVAMIDPESSSEHDLLLWESAFADAAIWLEKWRRS